MDDMQHQNEATDGRSDLTAVLATLRAENERLRTDFERESADIDAVFAAIGWDVARTRTEGGLLRVASLKNALRNIVSPGD